MTKAKTVGKSKAEVGLLEAVRDMKAGRAARVFVPDGKGGVVRSEVARARLASGLTQQNSHRYWGFPCAPCRNGSRGARIRQGRHALC